MTAWIGLTGGIGSGKSQAALCFKQRGIPIIDADAINRTLISTPNSDAIQKIQKTFGNNALDESGILNKVYMRQLIFNDVQAKQKLERILHPLIMHDIKQQQQHIHTVYGIVELPTLTEHPHFRDLVSRVLLIYSSEHIRIQRVMQRSSLSQQEVAAIISAQASDEQRRLASDDIIYNTGSLSKLDAEVGKQHTIYQRLFNP